MNERYLSVAHSRAINPNDNAENDATAFTLIQSIYDRRKIIRLHDTIRKIYAETNTMGDKTINSASEKQSRMGIQSLEQSERDLSAE